MYIFLFAVLAICMVLTAFMKEIVRMCRWYLTLYLKVMINVSGLIIKVGKMTGKLFYAAVKYL